MFLFHWGIREAQTYVVIGANSEPETGNLRVRKSASDRIYRLYDAQHTRQKSMDFGLQLKTQPQSHWLSHPAI